MDKMIGDGIKKFVLMGIGAAAMTVEKSQQMVDELVKKGELTVEQGKELNQELKRNVKKTIDEAVIESHDDVDNPTRQRIDDALNNRTRFIQWSELYNHALFARVDIVAQLMYLYTQWDYSMWDAIEALAQERNDIPFWVLRVIILQAERVNYFGENNEGGKDNE